MVSTIGKVQRAMPSKRGPRGKPRGRDLDPAALTEIESLLGLDNDGSVRRRDLLIEHLHILQDEYGHLALRHLRALAAFMNLPMAEVYETATFYAHFDVVHDGQTPPAQTTIRVCDSLSCQLAGADTLQAELKAGVDPEQVRVVRAPCMGRCEMAQWLKSDSVILAMRPAMGSRRCWIRGTTIPKPSIGRSSTTIAMRAAISYLAIVRQAG